MSECLFCKIVEGDVSSDRVYEDDHVVAFRDIHPQAPVHLLIVPRRHIGSLNDAGEGERELLGRVLLVARELAAREGVGQGYRLVNNCGESAGQSVFHLHVHLLGGRSLRWPPG